jgi:hypothetical protein
MAVVGSNGENRFVEILLRYCVLCRSGRNLASLGSVRILSMQPMSYLVFGDFYTVLGHILCRIHGGRSLERDNPGLVVSIRALAWRYATILLVIREWKSKKGGMYVSSTSETGKGGEGGRLTM